MRQTSIEAHASISPEEISQVQALILDTLREGSLTDAEIGARLPGIAPSSLRTRRSELVALGLVLDTGEFRRSEAGRRMIVWGVVRSGMRPNSMPGRPDRYVNMDLARAQAADAVRREEERKLSEMDEARKAELRKLPWREGPPRITFGQSLCRYCYGTGGNEADGPCPACRGEGVL